MLDGEIPAFLEVAGREAIQQAYLRCSERLHHDPSGALTSARSLIEETCHYALVIQGIHYEKKDDLPKLIKRTADSLSLDAAKATNTTYKRIAGAITTLVQAVGELRNQSGDAHGSAAMHSRLEPQAKLAVATALSIAEFLLASVDAFVVQTHRQTTGGEAILKFDKSTVWRLVDHSQNAKKILKSFGEKRGKRCLWLVGDSGIYLMSNGAPPILENGKVVPVARAKGQRRLVAYAEGCGPNDELDSWWPIHKLIAEGSDFSLSIPLEFFIRALEASEKYIIIVGTEEGVLVVGDLEYEVPARLSSPSPRT